MCLHPDVDLDTFVITEDTVRAHPVALIHPEWHAPHKHNTALVRCIWLTGIRLGRCLAP